MKDTKLAEERCNFYVALTRSRGSVLPQLSLTGQDARKKTVQHGYSSFALELVTSLGQSVGPAPKTAAHASLAEAAGDGSESPDLRSDARSPGGGLST